MKTIQVSDDDYRLLEYLGSDKWMSIKGEPPCPVEKVIHRIIAAEYEAANPTRFRAIQERGD